MAPNPNGSVVNRLSSNNWSTILVPAHAEIPAPKAYVKFVAVKTHVVAVGSFRSQRWPTGSVPLARRAGRLARGDVGPTKVPIGVQLSG